MIVKIILLLILLVSAFLIGKCKGYEDGFIDGRLEEKFRRRK